MEASKTFLKFTNIRQILTHEFQNRQNRNRSYSLRCFARDLNLAPSQVSRLISGKSGISSNTALKISKSLSFDQERAQHFLNLASMEFSRSTTAREASKEALIQSKPAFTPLHRTTFKTISEWYHLPIICLIELPEFQENTKWIAQRLKLDPRVVKPAIQRLLKLGMIKRDPRGRLRSAGDFFTNAEGLPSSALRTFHQQIIAKAHEAVEEQNTQERFLSTLVLPVDDDEMVEAQIFIQQFLNDFKKRFSRTSTSKKEVYALALQYFSLTDLHPEESS